MSLVAPTLFIGSLQAAGSAVATKAPGSVARVNDAWNAKSPLKENTIKGEALTLGQVGTYAVLGNGLVAFLQTRFPKFAQKTQNRPLLLLILSVMSNCVAEVVSRKFFNRKIDGSHQAASAVPNKRKWDDDDDDHPVKRLALANNPFAQAAAPEVMFAHAAPSPYMTHYPQSSSSFASVRPSPFRL